MTQPTEPLTWRNPEFDEEDALCTHDYLVWIPEYEGPLAIPRNRRGESFIPVYRL
jgi:hypothetical protein